MKSGETTKPRSTEIHVTPKLVHWILTRSALAPMMRMYKYHHLEDDAPGIVGLCILEKRDAALRSKAPIRYLIGCCYNALRKGLTKTPGITVTCVPRAPRRHATGSKRSVRHGFAVTPACVGTLAPAIERGGAALMGEESLDAATMYVDDQRKHQQSKGHIMHLGDNAGRVVEPERHTTRDPFNLIPEQHRDLVRDAFYMGRAEASRRHNVCRETVRSRVEKCIRELRRKDAIVHPAVC